MVKFFNNKQIIKLNLFLLVISSYFLTGFDFENQSGSKPETYEIIEHKLFDGIIFYIFVPDTSNKYYWYRNSFLFENSDSIGYDFDFGISTLKLHSEFCDTTVEMFKKLYIESYGVDEFNNRNTEKIDLLFNQKTGESVCSGINDIYYKVGAEKEYIIYGFRLKGEVLILNELCERFNQLLDYNTYKDCPIGYYPIKPPFYSIIDVDSTFSIEPTYLAKLGLEKINHDPFLYETCN